MPICYCSACHPGASKSIKTIKKHLKDDRVLLSNGQHHPQMAGHLQRCIEGNIKELSREMANMPDVPKSHSHSTKQNDSTSHDIIMSHDSSSASQDVYAHDIDMFDDTHPTPSAFESDFHASKADDHSLDTSASSDDESEPDASASSGDESDSLTGGFLNFPSIQDSAMDQDFDHFFDDAEKEVYIPLPESITSLRKELLGNYQCPKDPPGSAPMYQTLTPSQKFSLKHYVAWKKSNGTVKAYSLHAANLKEASGHDILSLHQCQKLAEQITELKACQVDICPNSCIAYTGQYKNLTACPYKKDGEICGLPRYDQKRKKSLQNKPQAQMMCLPIMATIKAMFANADTAKLLRHRDRCLQQALHATATAIQKFSDFSDSKVHMHHYKMGLFQDPRDIALAISTDGAQLTMKKQSNTWLVLLLLFNLPPEIRYKYDGPMLAFATPGPKSPGNMESFLYPVFENMAMASEGIWMWDAVDSSYFINRAYICMALGDMLGSAKLNGMAGHSAIYGDRFSMVKGAKASKSKGAKAQYYPTSPPCNSEYNPGRPNTYDLDRLPIRQEPEYWATIEKIQKASTKAARDKITKETGVVRLPLCAASRAFIHPTFFPLDPFHLFYENIAACIWDLWTSQSSPIENRIHIPEEKRKKIGKLVSDAMPTLPPSFCGPVRDPHLKRQSQYKVYEWMALVHWYIIPIGLELELDPAILQNYSYFVEAVEFAMTIKARSADDIKKLHNIVKKFLQGFEKLYIGSDPEKISRAKLCIFQLIHVSRHIEWNGSIRIGSQATVERAIGEMGHKIRSKKAPFANLANIIYEKELVKLLLLYYPSLDPLPKVKPAHGIKLIQKIRISKKEMKSDCDLYKHLEKICLWLKQEPTVDLEVGRYGKFRLPSGIVLRSRLGENKGKTPTRSARYFEAEYMGNPLFGEALAFYEIINRSQYVMVYQPFVEVKGVLCSVQGKQSKDIEVLPLSSLCNLIGIFYVDISKKVYILRKHPGLALLSEADKGMEIEEVDDDDDDYD